LGFSAVVDEKEEEMTSLGSSIILLDEKEEEELRVLVVAIQQWHTIRTAKNYKVWKA
jgi:hypothetical protein